MKPSDITHQYLPGLNGLRALAAGSVLFLHINDGLPLWHLPNWGHTDGGLFAVTVFFALSGFLITYLLLREKESTQKVSITNFYIRRTLRIWPLYFISFGGTLVFNYFVGAEYDHSLIPVYFLFAANIPNSINLFIGNAGHFWSLSVEEQFYLMWPWMIKFGRKPIYVLVAFLVIFTLTKLILRYTLGGVAPVYMFFFITRFDCMAIGGIGAWLFLNGLPAGLQRILFSIPVQIISWLALALTIPDLFHVFTFVDHALIAVATVIVILNLIANPKPIWRLEHRVWRYLGGISFGIYMWHMLVIAANAELLPLLPFPGWGKIVFLVVVVPAETILVAHLSMKYLESPFLRLKDRFGWHKK